jgi:hypothetical protein
MNVPDTVPTGCSIILMLSIPAVYNNTE